MYGCPLDDFVFDIFVGTIMLFVKTEYQICGIFRTVVNFDVCKGKGRNSCPIINGFNNDSNIS